MDLTAMDKGYILKDPLNCTTLFSMKRLTILLLAVCIQLGASIYAQKISLTLKDASLESAFVAIQKQSTYSFVYTREELQQAKKSTVNIRQQEIEPVLQLCFREQPLTYTIVDKCIIVRAKETGSGIVRKDALVTIRGIVVGEEGPLEGVSVRVKNTGNGGVTNAAGEFILREVSPNAVLVFSYVGYDSQEIPITKQSYSVQLRLAIKSLDETIVRAYGTTTRRLNTGNISKITADEISKQPVANPLAALEGRVPGLVITQQTGVPGGSFTIQIRGQNSLRNTSTSNGNLPLFIIDEVPFTPTSLSDRNNISLGITNGGNPLSSLNPADIESIEILKDADATAIYGSRGANGVILITTKKGKAGKTKLDVNVSSGISAVADLHRVSNMTLWQYLEVRRTAFANSGLTPAATTAPDLMVW